MATGELRDILYWNPITGAWESTPPTFLVGHWNGLGCTGINLSSTVQQMYFTFNCYDPNGYLIGTWTSPSYSIGPGLGLAANYAVYCAIPGDYLSSCTLYIANQAVDNITEVVAHVTAVGEVKALIDTWWLWDAVKNAWVRPWPLLIPLNSDIGIRGRAQNSSDFTVNMRMNAITHSPSGKTQTKVGATRSVLPGLYPSQYPTWDFIRKGDEFGDWEADLILYAARPGDNLVEVDRRENISIAAVQTAAPPEAAFSGLTINFNKTMKV